MKYDWILFDADETIFHFDAFKGMQLMFKRKGVEFTASDYHQYQQLNKPLWDKYQQGLVTATEIKHTRFELWADKLDTTTMDLNSSFLQAMADICTLLPGAKELIESLYDKARLAIITNGFVELQSIRLEKVGLADRFEHVFISEEVGIAKPDSGIFDYAMNKMGQPDRAKVLMVGDNLHSDIVGGNNYGIDTCWLNRSGEALHETIKPNYTVSCLHELNALLLN
ncbi:pyrimidine 5'-nucleotidase [Vibrio marisflavi]|uniref:Pyrimidine 5'-nucleotidase YjjG n=1 Tax=Vibrio marisflavi CECT 7928 TaxID=634439 RepID=A0ABM9A0Q5_9VIBR|nr:pyrimidine 5'-nucleotidase [Vibrio marisflavi]CAH0536981.1 Pyrimidine 5'-nucleotidase YjjG [Vibrio marisflavi CECT 7928]